MFRAIGRWFRSLMHFVSGRVDNSRRALDTDPHAMRSQYDAVIREKTERIQQYKQAVAGLVHQQESKMAKAKELAKEVQRLEELKAGALAKAQSVVAKLTAAGASKDAIHADADYQTCLGAYNDFSSTIAEKKARMGDHEGDVAEYGKRIKEHQVQLKELVREIEKLQAERSEAVADVISAKQERALADSLSGIATNDGTADKLAELRSLRGELRAEARVSKELAGTEAKSQEADFLEYARKNANTSEFDKLIGLASAADAPVAAPAASEAKQAAQKLPE